MRTTWWGSNVTRNWKRVLKKEDWSKRQELRLSYAVTTSLTAVIWKSKSSWLRSSLHLWSNWTGRYWQQSPRKVSLSMRDHWVPKVAGSSKELVAQSTKSSLGRKWLSPMGLGLTLSLKTKAKSLSLTMLKFNLSSLLELSWTLWLHFVSSKRSEIS